MPRVYQKLGMLILVASPGCAALSPISEKKVEEGVKKLDTNISEGRTANAHNFSLVIDEVKESREATARNFQTILEACEEAAGYQKQNSSSAPPGPQPSSSCQQDDELRQAVRELLQDLESACANLESRGVKITFTRDIGLPKLGFGVKAGTHAATEAECREYIAGPVMEKLQPLLK